MRKNILEKLVAPLVLTGFIGINLLGAHLQNKVLEANHGKVMPEIQPWRWIYDDNNDGNPDRTIEAYVGGPGGAIRYMITREPTKEEINWYKNN